MSSRVFLSWLHLSFPWLQPLRAFLWTYLDARTELCIRLVHLHPWPRSVFRGVLVYLFLFPLFPQPCSYCCFYFRLLFNHIARFILHGLLLLMINQVTILPRLQSRLPLLCMEEALRSSGTARKNKLVLDLHTSLYPYFSELFHRNDKFP